MRNEKGGVKREGWKGRDGKGGIGRDGKRGMEDRGWSEGRREGVNERGKASIMSS